MARSEPVQSTGVVPPLTWDTAADPPFGMGVFEAQAIAGVYSWSLRANEAIRQGRAPDYAARHTAKAALEDNFGGSAGSQSYVEARRRALAALNRLFAEQPLWNTDLEMVHRQLEYVQACVHIELHETVYPTPALSVPADAAATAASVSL